MNFGGMTMNDSVAHGKYTYNYRFDLNKITF